MWRLPDPLRRPPLAAAATLLLLAAAALAEPEPEAKPQDYNYYGK